MSALLPVLEDVLDSCPVSQLCKVMKDGGYTFADFAKYGGLVQARRRKAMGVIRYSVKCVFFFRCFSTADLANLLVCRSFSRHGGNSLLALLLVLAPGLPFDLLRPGGIIAGGYVRPLKSLDHPRPEQRDGRFSGKSRI